MPQWPIRVKLIAGLSLVVGMMLTLMGGSMFGLHAFHSSNLTLVDQLRERGASKELVEVVLRLEPPNGVGPEQYLRLDADVKAAQLALIKYHQELRRTRPGGTAPTTAATS